MYTVQTNIGASNHLHVVHVSAQASALRLPELLFCGPYTCHHSCISQKSTTHVSVFHSSCCHSEASYSLKASRAYQ